MAKIRKIAGTISDATLPRTPITIGGQTYNLCFTFGALARAERAINGELERSGSRERINILAALPILNAGNIALLFAAAIWQFHPEVGFEAAQNLVTFENFDKVSSVIVEAFNAAMPETEKTANPIPGGR